MSEHYDTFPTKEIVYPDGRVLIVDYVDDDFLLDHWTLAPLGYATRIVNQWDTQIPEYRNRKKLFLHRLIVERILNRPLSKHEEIDHINGNPLDNRRSNLRLATRTENARNVKKPKTNTTGYKGVYFRKNSGRYIAIITVNKKQVFLGSYDDPKEAYQAYCDAAKKYFGDFARFE